jgi:hypothetical protein
MVKTVSSVLIFGGIIKGGSKKVLSKLPNSNKPTTKAILSAVTKGNYAVQAGGAVGAIEILKFVGKKVKNTKCREVNGFVAKADETKKLKKQKQELHANNALKKAAENISNQISKLINDIGKSGSNIENKLFIVKKGNFKTAIKEANDYFSKYKKGSWLDKSYIDKKSKKKRTIRLLELEDGTKIIVRDFSSQVSEDKVTLEIQTSSGNTKYKIRYDGVKK